MSFASISEIPSPFQDAYCRIILLSRNSILLGMPTGISPMTSSWFLMWSNNLYVSVKIKLRESVICSQPLFVHLSFFVSVFVLFCFTSVKLMQHFLRIKKGHNTVKHIILTPFVFKRPNFRRKHLFLAPMVSNRFHLQNFCLNTGLTRSYFYGHQPAKFAHRYSRPMSVWFKFI